MGVAQVIGFGLVAAALIVLMRQHRPEFALLISIAGGLGLLLYVAAAALPVLSQAQGILSRTKIPGTYLKILLQALGICYLTQFAADACRDAGESSIASKIELAGKVAVVVLALPLFSQLIDVIGKLIG